MTDDDPLVAALLAVEPDGADEVRDLEATRRIAAGLEPWGRATPLHATGSALVVHPPTQRVLLRWHRRQQAWLQVGGHADPGEVDPLAVARREAEEETGLTDLVAWPDEPARLLHVVVVPVPPAGDEPAHHHADLRYVLATERPDEVRSESDDAPLRWLSVPAAHDLTSEANLRETLARVGRLLRCAQPR
jgi:8-oxo-dGTP pyrophosphatase MutT (NUDIX family)